MIVKELIAQLQTIDKDIEVLVSWDCQTAGDISSVKVIKFDDVYGDLSDDEQDEMGMPDKWLEINGNW